MENRHPRETRRGMSEDIGEKEEIGVRVNR